MFLVCFLYTCSVLLTLSEIAHVNNENEARSWKVIYKVVIQRGLFWSCKQSCIVLNNWVPYRKTFGGLMNLISM